MVHDGGGFGLVIRPQNVVEGLQDDDPDERIRHSQAGSRHGRVDSGSGDGADRCRVTAAEPRKEVIGPGQVLARSWSTATPLFSGDLPGGWLSEQT